jgi:hypothetical protein
MVPVEHPEPFERSVHRIDLAATWDCGLGRRVIPLATG